MKTKEREALLQALKSRFEKNMRRHAGVAWAEVLARLDANPAKRTSRRTAPAKWRQRWASTC
jgi:hypothetical protein